MQDYVNSPEVTYKIVCVVCEWGSVFPWNFEFMVKDSLTCLAKCFDEKLTLEFLFFFFSVCFIPSKLHHMFIIFTHLFCQASATFAHIQSHLSSSSIIFPSVSNWVCRLKKKKLWVVEDALTSAAFVSLWCFVPKWEEILSVTLSDCMFIDQSPE